MVDDMVGEMAELDWNGRRILVNRIMEVALAAQQVRTEVDPDCPWAHPEVTKNIVGRVLAAVLDRLGAGEVTCTDSAAVFALSADEFHRQAAGRWYAANPEDWLHMEVRGATMH